MEGKYSRFYAPQDAVPIAHPPLQIVNLLQPRIDLFPAPGARCTARHSRHAPGGARGKLRGLGGRAVGFETLDVLALIRGAFQPGDQIQSFDENEVLHPGAGLGCGGEFIVEGLGAGDVVGDADVLFLPCEQYAAEVDRGFGGGEAGGG